MTNLLRLNMALGIAIIFIAVLWVTAIAEVPKPVVPKANGEQCVEETDFMRREHMSLLMHQRDETVRRGIRTKKHSLAECINCHIQPNDQGVYPENDSKAHFCGACHAYTAVKIDCFQCHRSTPENAPPQTTGGGH